MKKTNYRIALEKMHPNAFKPLTELVEDPETGQLVQKDIPLKVVKVSDLGNYEFLSFGTPDAEKKAARLAEKENNKLIPGYTIESVDGKKIQIHVPKRLKHLAE